MLLEHVPCDLCGRDRYRVRYRKPDNWLRGSLFEFPVVECDYCGLVYVSPRPDMDSMSAFYPEGYHDQRNNEDSVRRYQVQQSMLPNLNGKKILDIGCAKGDFLSFLLQNGPEFEAHGTDAFSSEVKDSRIQFVRGDFSQSGYADDYFDLVMSWAVFEHIHNPTAYFAEAARVMRPGGTLVILVTNANSFYGKSGYLEDVPRHTYHYSPRTLAAFAEKVGLRLNRIEFDDRVFDGRGRGTFRFLAGRLVGFSWEKYMREEVSALQRFAMALGGALDLVVFSSHWEARMGRSGIMIATYEKP